MRKSLAVGVAVAVAGTVTWEAHAQTAQYTMTVAAGPSVNNPYRLQHLPFFSIDLPAAADGRLDIQMQAQDQMGLRGPEVVGLLSRGVVDVAYGSFNYLAGEDPRLEGIDLPGMTLDASEARAAAEAYKPVVEDALREQHNAKLLNVSPVSLQVVYCKQPVSRLSDFTGLKVRVFGVAMAEYFQALDAVTVDMPFVEVLPALQRGVVDCAITSTINGNTARWWEITQNMYSLGMGWGMVFFAANMDWWNGLDDETRELLTEQFAMFEDKLWDQAVRDVQNGIRCNTGEGECIDGITVPEDSQMTHVAPHEDDRPEHERILQETVLAGWAARCGADCTARWNETIGETLRLTAEVRQ